MNRGVMRGHPTRLSAPCAQGQEGLRPDRQCEMGFPLVTGAHRVHEAVIDWRD
jgi:hypothetical protein